jgi:tetratricopeptide (TPR) repeat protein
VKQLRIILGLTLLAMLLTSCASQKNTASTRWWKSFKSRYNTYFNGHQAYIDGMRTKAEGNKDNFTDFLPLMMVSNKSSKDLGKGNFETTITKCEKTIKLHSIKNKPEYKRGHRLTPKEKEFRNRKEFNPFLKNAWILMGKAQLQRGEYIEAASTFAYAERLYRDQPQVASIARSLAALCYTQLDWYYDAEDLLNKVRRDSIPRAARRPYNTAITNFHLRQKHWQEALPYLKQEVSNMPHGIPRARGYYLLGQVYQALNMKKEAYKALQKCLNQSPPYEMKFNAQILQTEVMPQGDNKKKLAKLNRMTHKANNKNYLDRIYYAIGNIYMAIPDTNKAIASYETGNEKATQNGPAKAALNLNLGDIYWSRQRFDKAQRCYNMALGVLDKEHPRYEELSKRTKTLDKLVPYTNEIFLQDSLQTLVRMPEKERLAVIDKLIELEKKRQKEAAKAAADSAANAREGKQTGGTNVRQTTTDDNTANANSGGAWYFYNQQSVTQGSDQFRKLWGNRKNEDNWRRINKTVIASLDNEGVDYEKEDSLENARLSLLNDSTVTDSTQLDRNGTADNDSIPNDPLTREYYLAQLPFTEEQITESNNKIREALFPAGVIEKDELENYLLARNTFMRLYTEFPEFEHRDELLYQLFLLELHWGSQNTASIYKNELAASYPESPFTLLITAPDYEENARFGKHLEDSLYTATYNAYRMNDYATMEQNCAISKTKYPQGENRAKFMFLDAMTLLRKGDIKGFADELRELAKSHPEDKISELAGSIVKSIDEGRVPGKEGYDIGSLWGNRINSADAEADAALKQDSLTADRNTSFVFILPYANDSIDEGQLLYEVSRFNFTNFSVRNFEIELIQSGSSGQLCLKGFLSFDEVHRYQQEIFKDSACHVLLKHIKPVLISEHNLRLIGIKYTAADYEKFYQKHFVPSKVKEDLKIDQDPSNFIWDEFQEVDEKDEEKEEEGYSDDDIEDDGGEWY